MILQLSFEELRALASAGELVVAGEARGGAAVVTRPEWAERVERLLPRLTGDVSVATIEEQRDLRATLGPLVAELHRRLDQQVIETYPGHEEAVALYFDYAYARSVLERVDRMGAEMIAIADLIAGGDAAAHGAVTFPD